MSLAKDSWKFGQPRFIDDDEDALYIEFPDRTVKYVPERTCEMYRDEDGVWCCKSCEDGADKITGSSGMLYGWCDSWHPNYCPSCGCRVKED